MPHTTYTKTNLLAVIIIALIGTFFAYAPLFTHSADAAMRIGKVTERNASSTAKVRSTENLTCMQTAVDTREDALATAHDTYATAHKAGLTDRKTALHTAWGLSDGSTRKSAIKAAWSAWNSDLKAARSDLMRSKKSAWKTFKTTAKDTCKETLPKEEAPKADTEA